MAAALTLGNIGTEIKFDFTFVLNGVPIVPVTGPLSFLALEFCCSKNARNEETWHKQRIRTIELQVSHWRGLGDPFNFP
jgi:hypothetical protein